MYISKDYLFTDEFSRLKELDFEDFYRESAKIATIPAIPVSYILEYLKKQKELDPDLVEQCHIALEDFFASKDIKVTPASNLGKLSAYSFTSPCLRVLKEAVEISGDDSTIYEPAEIAEISIGGTAALPLDLYLSLADIAELVEALCYDCASVAMHQALGDRVSFEPKFDEAIESLKTKYKEAAAKLFS